jgi:hypothetical protein
VNPPGQSQKSITASDKEWPQIFNKFVLISTYWVQERAKEFYKENPAEAKQLTTSYNEALVIRASKAFLLSEEEDDKKYSGFIW